MFRWRQLSVRSATLNANVGCFRAVCSSGSKSPGAEGKTVGGSAPAQQQGTHSLPTRIRDLLSKPLTQHDVACSPCLLTALAGPTRGEIEKGASIVSVWDTLCKVSEPVQTVLNRFDAVKRIHPYQVLPVAAPVKEGASMGRKHRELLACLQGPLHGCVEDLLGKILAEARRSAEATPGSEEKIFFLTQAAANQKEEEERDQNSSQARTGVQVNVSEILVALRIFLATQPNVFLCSSSIATDSGDFTQAKKKAPTCITTGGGTTREIGTPSFPASWKTETHMVCFPVPLSVVGWIPLKKLQQLTGEVAAVVHTAWRLPPPPSYARKLLASLAAHHQQTLQSYYAKASLLKIAELARQLTCASLQPQEQQGTGKSGQGDDVGGGVHTTGVRRGDEFQELYLRRLLHVLTDSPLAVVQVRGLDGIAKGKLRKSGFASASLTYPLDRKRIGFLMTPALQLTIRFNVCVPTSVATLQRAMEWEGQTNFGCAHLLEYLHTNLARTVRRPGTRNCSMFCQEDGYKHGSLRLRFASAEIRRDLDEKRNFLRNHSGWVRCKTTAADCGLMKTPAAQKTRGMMGDSPLEFDFDAFFGPSRPASNITGSADDECSATPPPYLTGVPKESVIFLEGSLHGIDGDECGHRSLQSLIVGGSLEWYLAYVHPVLSQLAELPAVVGKDIEHQFTLGEAALGLGWTQEFGASKAEHLLLSYLRYFPELVVVETETEGAQPSCSSETVSV